MIKINQNEFRKNLLLTQAYCDMQLQNKSEHIAGALRSFNPGHNGKELVSYLFCAANKYSEDFFSMVWSNDPIWENTDSFYGDLFQMQLEHKRKIVGPIVQDIDYKGRVLVAEIDLTVRDGASEAQSKGLFDINDCPPIDTWVFMSENEMGKVLYAWIPEQFIPLADIAIAVNCVDCIAWIEDFNETDRIKIDQKPGIWDYLKKLFS